MNKTIHLVGILTTLFTLTATITGRYFLFSRSKPIQENQRPHDDLPTYSIGISIYKPCPGTEKLVAGFTKYMNMSTKAHYEYKIGKADGNKLLLRSITEDLVNEHIDLIFTIGTNCSQLAKEITRKRNVKIPIVFCGVKNPVSINLVDSENMPGANITGVAAVGITWSDRIDYLLTLKPDIKHAVIPCSHTPGSMLERDVEEITEKLEANNITAQVIPIYSINDFKQKVLPFLTSQVDLAFVLRDGITINCMETLVKRANRENITIFSSYLESVEQGAAVGIGSYEETFGMKSAEMVRRILEQKNRPAVMPVTYIGTDGYELQINTKTAPLQGLKVDPKLTFFIKNARFV